MIWAVVVAQWQESWQTNQQVAGSNPARCWALFKNTPCKKRLNLFDIFLGKKFLTGEKKFQVESFHIFLPP